MLFYKVTNGVAVELISVPVIPDETSERSKLMFSLYGLNLSGQCLALHCLDFIAHHCPNLQELNLEDCSLERAFVPEGEALLTDGIRSISRGCPKLKSLNLAGICLRDAVESCSILSTMSCLECLGVSCSALVQPKLVSSHDGMLSPVLDPDAKRCISSTLASMENLRALQVWPCITYLEEHNIVGVLASQNLLSLC